jgi:hypothetical protein
VAEAKHIMGRASRYDTIIATLVGVCALSVSAYTAWVQRQQVRAAVWPIVEFDTGNDPNIYFTLANKGIGPAIIRRVIVKVNGEPVKGWFQALDKLLGDGDHRFRQITMTGRVLAAGETLNVFVPFDLDGTPLTASKGGPIWEKLNEGRKRVSVEICYCSTLGDCWTLRSNAMGESSTTESRGCAELPATVFGQ